MRTKLLCFLMGVVLALGVGFMPLRAVAASGNYGLNQTANKAGYKSGETVQSSVDKVVSTLLALLAIIFFILVTYAGLRWMLARGNEESASEAKNTLEAAVIGLIIITSAYAITTFVFSKL